MRKILALIMAIMILSLFVTGCAKKTDQAQTSTTVSNDATSQVSQSIDDIDTLNKNLTDSSLDKELVTAENSLDKW